MNKINIENWKEFKISYLFDVVLSKGDIQAKKAADGTIPLVSSGKFNNGICKYIAEGDGKAKIFNGNVITTDMFGKSFYQQTSFYAVSHGRVNILIPRFELNKNIAIFLVSIFDSTFLEKYSFSGMCNQTELNKEVIKLPATQTGEPDFQYMEEYIKNIEELQNRNLQIIKLLPPPPDKSVNTESWKHFKVSELFKVISGKGITKQEIYEHAGELPAIQSGEDNFGRIGYLDYNYCVSKKYAISKGECLTVARSGSSGFVGYQPKQCVVGDSAKILEPKFEANTNRLLYIRALLMVNKSLFAYTDKVTTSNYENSTIPLPVTQSGEPDFQYMEQTITALIVQQQAKLQRTQKTFA